MRKLVIVLVLMAGAAWGSQPILERLMLYPFDPRYETPAQAGIPDLTELRLKSDDIDLVVWTAAPSPGKPVIIYFHGNAGNLAGRAGRFKRFLNQGYGLYALGYRGSSGSKGWPNQTALTTDAELTIKTAQRRHPNAPVVLYGESLGTAVVIQTLESVERINAVLLEAPFTNIPEMAEKHYPSLAQYIPYNGQTWDSLAKSHTLTMPLLVLHGTQDPLTPIAMARRIFDMAPSHHKTFVAAKGAGHVDTWRSDTLPKMWQFIDRYATDRK